MEIACRHGQHGKAWVVQEAHHGYLQQGRGVLENKLPWQQNCHGSTSSSPALLISWKSCLHVIFFGTTQGECLHKMSQSHSRIGFNTLSIQSGIFFRKRTISGSAFFWWYWYVSACLQFFSGKQLKEELNNIDNLSEERLDELSKLFLKDLKNGQMEPHVWPTGPGRPAYKVSKALTNAYSRIIAKKNPTLCVNCVNPGYVSTDMNFHTGDLTVEEARKGSSNSSYGTQGRNDWSVFGYHRGGILCVTLCRESSQKFRSLGLA